MQKILIENLSYRYRSDSHLVLKNINLQIEEGISVAITGLTGCGKSTLCLCMSGVLGHKKDGLMTGKVIINGKDIRKVRRGRLALDIGIVFQDPDNQLFSPTVEDEIAFAPENLCIEPDTIRKRIDEVLEILEITQLRNENPYNLSGGEKQLVALGAVLALAPPILILDEVLSPLDGKGKRRVISALKNLKDDGKTIIIVEHDLKNIEFTDKLLVLAKGSIKRFDKTQAVLADRDFLVTNQLVYT